MESNTTQSKFDRKSAIVDLLDVPVENLKTNGVFKPHTSPLPSTYERAQLDSKIELNPEGENEFHNQRKPTFEIQCEKPHHRIMLYLAAEGNTATEIAQITGYTTLTVNNVLKQPWAAKKIGEILQESGKSKVELVLKGAALAAVERLVVEMDNSDARSSERISAADKILDRVYGKPNQPMTVKTEGKSLDQMSDAEIAAELDRVRGNRN